MGGFVAKSVLNATHLKIGANVQSINSYTYSSIFETRFTCDDIPESAEYSTISF